MARSPGSYLLAAVLAVLCAVGVWRWRARADRSPEQPAAASASSGPTAAEASRGDGGAVPPAPAAAGAASGGAPSGAATSAAAAEPARGGEADASAQRLRDLQSSLSALEAQPVASSRAIEARDAQRFRELEAQLAASGEREAAGQRRIAELGERLATLEARLSSLEDQQQGGAASPRLRASLAGEALDSTTDAARRLAQGSGDVTADLDAAQERIGRLRGEAARYGVGPEAEQARTAEQALGMARAYLAQGDLYNAWLWVRASVAATSRALSMSQGTGAAPSAAPAAGGY